MPSHLPAGAGRSADAFNGKAFALITHTTEECSFRCTRPLAKRPIAPTWELFPTPCGRLWDVRAKLLWGGRFETPELFVKYTLPPPKPAEIALSNKISQGKDLHGSV